MIYHGDIWLPRTPAPIRLELTATGRVILGMIAFGQRTGYDIKAFVDKTDVPWAASYGRDHRQAAPWRIVLLGRPGPGPFTS